MRRLHTKAKDHGKGSLRLAPARLALLAGSKQVDLNRLEDLREKEKKRLCFIQQISEQGDFSIGCFFFFNC